MRTCKYSTIWNPGMSTWYESTEKALKVSPTNTMTTRTMSNTVSAIARTILIYYEMWQECNTRENKEHIGFGETLLITHTSYHCVICCQKCGFPQFTPKADTNLSLSEKSLSISLPFTQCKIRIQQSTLQISQLQFACLKNSYISYIILRKQAIMLVTFRRHSIILSNPK